MYHPERVVQVRYTGQPSTMTPPPKGSDLVYLTVDAKDIVTRVQCGRSIPAPIKNLSNVFRVYYSRINDQVLEAYSYINCMDIPPPTFVPGDPDPTEKPSGGTPAPDVDIDNTQDVNVNVTVERDSFGNITRGDPFFGLGTYPGLSGELNVGAINQNFSSEKTVSGGGMQIGDAGNASTSAPGSGGDSRLPLPPLPPPPPPQILEDSKGIDVTRIMFALCLLIALSVSGWLLYKNYVSGTTNNTKNNNNNTTKNNNNNNARRNNAAAAAANNVPDDFDFDPIPEDAPLPNAANVPAGNNNNSNDFDFETGDTFPNNNAGRRGNNAAAS